MSDKIPLDVNEIILVISHLCSCVKYCVVFCRKDPLLNSCPRFLLSYYGISYCRLHGVFAEFIL